MRSMDINRAAARGVNKAARIQCGLLRLHGGGSGASTIAGKTVDEWFESLDANQDKHITAEEVRSFLAAATDTAAVLGAIGVATVEDAVAAAFELDADSKKTGMSYEQFRRSFEALKMRGRLQLAPVRGLTPHDFGKLWHEKVSAHLEGTREWAFVGILAWFDASGTPPLFWLIGSGGTGKSVLTAALHKRIFERVVGWHYCRHDNPQASAPGALLRSLSAMLCHRLPGYAEALWEVPEVDVDDPKGLFASLFKEPLARVPVPEQPLLIIIDALDADRVPRVCHIVLQSDSTNCSAQVLIIYCRCSGSSFRWVDVSMDAGPFLARCFCQHHRFVRPLVSFMVMLGPCLALGCMPSVHMCSSAVYTRGCALKLIMHYVAHSADVSGCSWMQHIPDLAWSM